MSLWLSTITNAYLTLVDFCQAWHSGSIRMGYDAHWCYDVVGGALLGVGTTKFFI
jgi:hypothetical protein